MRIAVFAGTRPELIKTAPIIWAIQSHPGIELEFIHTGQHYDWALSERFIQELNLPPPNFFLNVRSGTQGAQTARIIRRAEVYLKKTKPTFVLITGDTNSAMGVSLAASKLHIAVGHIEAGCRSYDLSMPEEINRVIISKCATLHFAPTSVTFLNLLREGVFPGNLYLTGHPIVEALLHSREAIEKSDVLKVNGLEKHQYCIMTLHRAENVDSKERLKNILAGVLKSKTKIIFPVHPHCKKKLKQFRLTGMLKNIEIINPIGYFDMLKLLKYSAFVLTDSGGVQQEAAMLGVSCVTLRDNTEWVETVQAGLNTLTGDSISAIQAAIGKAENPNSSLCSNERRIQPLFGDEKTSERIINILETYTQDASASLAKHHSLGYPMSKLIEIKKEVAWNQLGRYTKYINTVFTADGFPIIPSGNAILQKGFKLLIFCPKDMLEGLISLTQK